MVLTRVVVGIAGRSEFSPVLRWAAAEAERRGNDLRILHATRPEACHRPVRTGPADVDRAAGLVTAAAEEARRWAPGVRVTGELVAGRPAATLISATGRRGLLVVGNREPPEPVTAVSGPTCQLVALNARSSVAVVRGGAGPETGPVAVGYDGSPRSEAALMAAFDAATARLCGLTVIRVVPSTAPGGVDDPRSPEARHDLTVRAALSIDARRIVAPLVGKYPEVVVDILVIRGDPAWHLVAASREARLIVIGSLGAGGVAGRRVDSAGLRVVHHAYCPVLIARA